MPRASKEQAATHRKTITAASARLFRERGFHGVSVADLMGAAGLTHGGFYVHFESKESLAVEACAKALEEGVARWRRRMAGESTPSAQRAALIDGYLSSKSRNDPGKSCAVAALVNDVAREPLDSLVRTTYTAGLEARLAILASVQQTGDSAEDRARAILDCSTMVGALVLSRATSGNALSDELLTVVREQLKSIAPNGASTR